MGNYGDTLLIDRSGGADLSSSPVIAINLDILLRLWHNLSMGPSKTTADRGLSFPVFSLQITKQQQGGAACCMAPAQPRRSSVWGAGHLIST
jgi:hypothetical protein